MSGLEKIKMITKIFTCLFHGGFLHIVCNVISKVIMKFDWKPHKSFIKLKTQHDELVKFTLSTVKNYADMKHFVK